MSIYKKHLPIAIALFLGTSQLSASLAYQNQDLSDRMTVIERERAEKARVSPVVKQSNDFFVTGDYLFMHANQSGIAYAVRLDADDTDDGKVKNVKFEWDSGFRVGVGYRMPHDNWELALDWTRFSTDAHGKTSDGIIFPEWIIDFPFGVTSMEAHWNMHLNILDGDISRYFMVTRKLALKPRFGIRGVWINQHYKTTREGGLSTVTKMKNDCAGVGLRAAFETEWNFVKHWSFYGDAGYSLVYSKFELKQKINSVVFGDLEIKDHFQDLVGIAELGLGLRWDYTFGNEWTALRLQAGWEFNAYFGQNRFEHFNSNATSTLSFIGNNNDLTLQGFVFSGRLDF